jgi:hypothetical protein
MNTTGIRKTTTMLSRAGASAFQAVRRLIQHEIRAAQQRRPEESDDELGCGGATFSESVFKVFIALDRAAANCFEKSRTCNKRNAYSLSKRDRPKGPAVPSSIAMLGV